MTLLFIFTYLVSLVVCWCFANYFINEETTNHDIYLLKVPCFIPLWNTVVVLIYTALYLEEKGAFDSLKNHLADKPLKRK